MPTVLVTGAARGIGRATTLRLAGAGWNVIAGVRRVQDGEALAGASPGQISWIELDVTDAAAIEALDAKLPATLDAVVNNAGVFVGGPVEAVPLAQLRRMLEINLVGSLAVTQAVLPRLRGSRGRIVFVSSVSGRVVTPMFGAYAASKFALEAAADALRMELAPWRIRVVVVEPAQTDTDLWRHADADFDAAVASLTPRSRELYARHLAGFRKTIPRSQKLAAPVEGVAACIEQALTAKRPRARYVVGASARAQALMALVTPRPLLDRLLAAGTGVPRKLQ
jgi:NAD(P)-dependent dehydrogenase (short-subunit alcohol dehydrogenase family)